MTSSSIASSEVVASKPSTSPRLAHVGDPQLDVVLERRVGDVAERPAVAVDLRPDRLGQLEHRRRRRGREVEVLVDRRRRLHREPDPARQVAAVGVVADLRPVAEDVQRVLALEHLQHEVGHDVAQRQLHVAAHDVRVADRPPLADPDAVERPQDRVRQLVLLPGALREVLGRELLEAVGRDRRRRRPLGALRGREDGRRLVDHRARQDDDPLEAAGLVRGDRRVERRGEDPLVLGQQVVGELVEVADPADHRRRRDDLVDVRGELGHQRRRPSRRPRRTGSAGGRRTTSPPARTC